MIVSVGLTTPAGTRPVGFFWCKHRWPIRLHAISPSETRSAKNSARAANPQFSQGRAKGRKPLENRDAHHGSGRSFPSNIRPTGKKHPSNRHDSHSYQSSSSANQGGSSANQPGKRANQGDMRASQGSMRAHQSGKSANQPGESANQPGESANRRDKRASRPGVRDKRGEPRRPSGPNPGASALEVGQSAAPPESRLAA